MRRGPKPTLPIQKTPSPPVPDLLETVPDPPATLDKPAAVLWWTTAQLLIDRRTLTRGDLVTLENYVGLSGMIRKATEAADWRLVDKLIGSQTRLARELGCTISSRVSIRTEPVEIEDELERWKREEAIPKRLRDGVGE